MHHKPPVSIDARRATRICSFKRSSALAGRVAQMRLPRPLLSAAIRAYARFFKVNMAESNRPPGEFSSFADFFARELKPGARRTEEVGHGLLSPADGTLHNFGTIEKGLIPQIKGRNYSVARLIADDQLARRLDGGSYATIYLSPADYHRVHSPADGRIVSCRHIPGALYSVSPFFVNHFRNLFLANERIPVHLETEYGLVTVVLVAATIVGRVTLTFSTLQTNQGNGAGRELTLDRPVPVHKGEQLGAFTLGSTVVLLTEGSWRSHLLAEGMPVKMGSTLFTRGDDS